MRRFLSLIVVCFSLLGIPGAEAVKLSVTAPSENSRIFAPTRDFYAIVSIDREGKNPQQEPFNVRFELYRDGDLNPLRTVTSAVSNATGLTPLNAIMISYAHGWTPGNSLDILDSPPPDLVYTPAQPVSFYTPGIKAVVTQYYAAAIIQGGCTKNFDTNYFLDDIEEGEYTLTVSAIGGGGVVLDSVSVPLTFGSVPDKVISRFSPEKHMENVTAFAKKNNSHIYTDLFPGYWDASKLPHGGIPGTLFYEIVRRWRPNDLLEYMNGTIRAVVYNIHGTSTTQSVELGGLAYAGRLGSNSVIWYHYDSGEVALNYNPGNGQTASKAGIIVPFPEGRRLVFVRAEIRGDGQSEIEPSDYVYSPELADKTVDWNVADGVAVKPKQLLSLFGVVKPIQPALDDVVANDDGTYTINNRIATVRYTLLDGTQELFSFDAKRVELTRTGINARPSIYEFRHDIPVPATFNKPWTVRVGAFDIYGTLVPGTEMSFTLAPYSPGGGGGGGGCSLGATPFALLLLLPLFALATRRKDV